ncbi:O-antigen ligase family protein [Roseateles sp. BYS87W]|uniref:O-antigen ligase family protein n=1 Tax=Pelomonas baiyunensis TaxID=3299026 RepID=A0ABW7H3I0_9BURK
MALALAYGAQTLHWWRRHLLLAAFAMGAVVAGMFVPLPPITAFLAAAPYIDASLMLVVAFCVLGPETALATLARGVVVLLLLNLASAAVPSVSVMVGEFAGRFRGLTAHRNDLAQLAYTGALLIVAARQWLPRVWVAVGLVAAVALIAGARSVQGILLLPLGLLVYLGAGRLRVLKHPLVLLTALALVGAVAAVWEQFGSLDSFLRYFGRDATFTGRDRIWALSLHLLQHMPFEGYGPGQIGSGVLSESLLQRFGLGTLFGSAHNAYLEAFLTYGWFGGALFMALLLAGASEIVRAVLRGMNTYTALSLALLLVALVGGLTASEKLFLPGFGWFTFVLAVVLAGSRTDFKK